MNPDLPPPSARAESDVLLARRYVDTSAEFESRWVQLKRDLRQRPAPAPGARWLRGWIFGAIAAGVWALVALVVPPAPQKVPSAALEELFVMDAVLHRAVVLLDAENRDALLHVSIPPRS